MHTRSLLSLLACLAILPLSACLSDDTSNRDGGVEDGGDDGGGGAIVGEGEGEDADGGGDGGDNVAEGEGEGEGDGDGDIAGEGEGEETPADGEGEGEGEGEEPEGPDPRHIERCMAACGVAEDCDAINAFVPANDFDGCLDVCLQRYELTEDPHAYDIVTGCMIGGGKQEENGRCGRINHCASARLEVPEQCDVICEPAQACDEMAPFEEDDGPWLTGDEECRYGCAAFMWLIGPFAAGQGWEMDDDWAQCTADFIGRGACGDGPMGMCLIEIEPECQEAAEMLERCTPEDQQGEAFDAFGFALGCSFGIQAEDDPEREPDPNFNRDWVECVADVPAEQGDDAFCAEAYTCIDEGCRNWIDVIVRCSPEAPDEGFNAPGVAIYCDGQLQLDPEDRDEDINVGVIECLEGLEPNADDQQFCAAAQRECFGPGQEQDPCERFCDKHEACDLDNPFGDAECIDACQGAMQAGGRGFELRVSCVNDGFCEHLDNCEELPLEPSAECVAICTGIIRGCDFGGPPEDGRPGEEGGDGEAPPPEDDQPDPNGEEDGEGGEGEGEPDIEPDDGCLRGCTATLAGRNLDAGDVSECLVEQLTPHCGEDGDGDMGAAGAKLFACLAPEDCHSACGVADDCDGLDEGETIHDCISECGNNLAAAPVEVGEVLECILEEDAACQDIADCIPEDGEGGDGEGPPPPN